MNDIQLVPIEKIVIENRHRQQMGDIESLAASINKLGLLQPVGVNPDYQLIFGHRRVLAHQLLGRSEIPARVIDIDVLLGEHDENELHKEFTISERVAIGRSMEARIGDRQGVRVDLDPQLVPNWAQVEQGEKTRDIAAKQAGFGSDNSYERAKKVVDHGTPELIEAVDRGDVSISAAALVASLPQEWQQVIVANDEVAEAAKEIRLGRQDAVEDRLKPHVANNSGNNEWYTPSDYIEAARQALGAIDLDPASSATANEIVKAMIFYSVEDDGLAKRWGGRIWMNPPYSEDLIGKFTDKLVGHFASGEVTAAVVLVNNATETKWFRQLINAASAVVFPASRVRFWRPDGKTAGPLQGQALIYMGEQPQTFRAAFGTFGWGATL